DPVPIAATITSAVWRVNLCHALGFGAVNALAASPLRHCLLPGRIGGVGLDHDHAQFNLLLAGELGGMLAIVILNPVRLDVCIEFHLLVPHRLHYHPGSLHFCDISYSVV